MKAISYVRISDSEQSNNSIPGQIADIENYCKRNGLSLQRTFVENGQSAFTFNRTEWIELESYLKSHKEVNYLVISSLDRFSRANLVDALQKMDEIQKRTKVKILTVSDPLNLDTEDFGVELRRIMELMFSNYELKKIRKRTSDGIYQSLASGRFINKAPFGYLNSRDENGKPLLKIDPDKSFVVRLIFRLYQSGMELEEIRKHIRANGFKLKGNSAIKRILNNHVYASLLKLPKRGTELSKLVKAIHPPIISESDYWGVQQRLNSKTVSVQKREEVYLRGVLHCGCGRKMTAGNSRGKSGRYFWYYVCKQHKKSLSAIKLHKQFEEILKLLTLPDERITSITERVKSMIEQRGANKGGDLMRANLSLKKVQDKINSVQEKFLTSPDISEKIYQKIITELKADEERLNTQIASLHSDSGSLLNIMNELIPKLSKLHELFFKWPLFKQQAFINALFFPFLSYEDGVYRTPNIHFLFAHNEVILKEKGLLLVQPLEGITPNRAENGNWVEPLKILYEIFAA